MWTRVKKNKFTVVYTVQYKFKMADLKGVSVTDLNATLEDPEVLDAFREFLRIKLDNNKSTNIDLKKKFEQWLDYVIICNKVIENFYSQIIYFLNQNYLGEKRTWDISSSFLWNKPNKFRKFTLAKKIPLKSRRGGVSPKEEWLFYLW